MASKNTLGIFQGKKREYNELILQSLLYSGKTTKEIAVWIIQNSPKKYWKSVYKTIGWSGGRLKELKDRGYIKRKDLVWQLTGKGNAVVLTLENNVSKVLSLIKKDVDPVDIDDVFEKLKQIPFISAFIKPEAIEDLKKVFLSDEYYEYVRDSVRQLIKKGVDLDSMSEEEFQDILSVLVARGFLEKKLFESI